MPLSKAVKYVRGKKSEYRCVEIKYADQVFAIILSETAFMMASRPDM